MGCDGFLWLGETTKFGGYNKSCVDKTEDSDSVARLLEGLTLFRAGVGRTFSASLAEDE